MRNFTKLLSFMLVVAFLFNSCRNPAYELNVIYDAQIITYKAALQLVDANGAALPENIDVSVTGTNAGSIYDFSGTKKIYAPAGIITVGVHPKEIPTAGNPLNFNVVVKIPGYIEQNIPVTIAVGQFSQPIKTITMVKTVVPTQETAVVVQQIALSPTGATVTATSFGTTASADVPQTTSISIPAGVTFKDAAGNTLVGGTLTAQAVNFDSADPDFASVFPGGDLKAPNVVMPDGSVGSAFFYPAGYTDITMFVGGVEVKTFSTPITVAMGLDPNFVIPGATGPIKAGDMLGVYSYQVSTGQFKFETNAAVTMVGGKPTLSFQTNHLTGFFAGIVQSTVGCTNPVATILAPGYTTATSVDVVISDIANPTRIYYEGTSTIPAGGGPFTFTDLPPSPVAYTIKKVSDGSVLAAGTILNPCSGSQFNITFPAPGANLSIVHLNLNVVCPGKAFIVPNFDLYYKIAGSSDAYKFLGTASDGQIYTTDLTLNSTYDFRATWGARVKEVKGRKIDNLDMVTTVDANPGGFTGNANANSNRALLIQACSELP